MRYGWFSARLAEQRAHPHSDMRHGQDGQCIHAFALNVYATADRRHAVVVTTITSAANDCGTIPEDAICLGEIDYWAGAMAVGAVPKAAMAVPLDKMFALVEGSLSKAETLKAELLAKRLAEAVGLKLAG